MGNSPYNDYRWEITCNIEGAFYHINGSVLSTLWQEHATTGHKENPIMLVRVRAAGLHIVLAVQVDPVNNLMSKFDLFHYCGGLAYFLKLVT